MNTLESTDLIFINANNFHHPLPENTNQLVLSSFMNVHDYENSRGLSLKICLSNRERYILNDADLHYLTPGKYLLVNKNTIVESQIDTKISCFGLCFYFNEEYFAKVAHSLMNSPEKQIDTISNSILPEAITEVCLPFYPDTPFYIQLCQLIPDTSRIDVTQIGLHGADLHFEAACFVAQQQNFIKRNIEKLQQVKQTTKKEILQRLIKAQHIIYECCCNDISISEIARQIGLSEFYFLRLYKQVFQISPYQHILQFRLAKAMDLLRKSKSMASEVAISCGFADLPSFTKAFKKRFGVLPSAIAKN